MSLGRAATDNLAEGLGMVRWDDDEAIIRELYPDAYIRHLPGVGAPLIIPTLVEGIGPVGVRGYFFLGPQGVEYVVLSEDSETDEVDVLPCVHALAHRFGFGPVTNSNRQVWVVRGVQVMLQLFGPLMEGGTPSEFYLRVNRPGVFLPDFRIFEIPLSPRRREPPPRHAWDDPELPAPVRPDRFVVCPFCERAFSLADSARWDGSRHLTCGQRIRLEPPPGS